MREDDGADVSGEAFQRTLERITKSPSMRNVLRQQNAIERIANSPSMRNVLRQQNAIERIANSPSMQNVLRQQNAIERIANPPGGESFLRAAEVVSTGLLAQLAALSEINSPTLDYRVIQAAKAWTLAIRPRSVSEAEPASVLHIGVGARAVADAAYAIDTEPDPAAEEWRRARDRETDELVDWLTSLDRRLADKFRGAWHALGTEGPDWISQSANSAVELLDWTLRLLAPDNDVVQWQAKVNLYQNERGDNGRPHRSLRVRYIAAKKSIPASSADLVIKAVTGTYNDLQKMKHRDDESMRDALRSALLAVEHCLLMLRGAPSGGSGRP